MPISVSVSASVFMFVFISEFLLLIIISKGNFQYMDMYADTNIDTDIIMDKLEQTFYRN
jgi:hypothetical protein